MPKRKVQLRPSAALYPVPVVLVSCINAQGEANVFTASWVGVASTSPAHLTLGLRPYRWSYSAIKETGEFVFNIPTRDLLKAVDICGHTAKSREERLKRAGLTLMEASEVKAPLVAECPVNIECKLVHELDLGSHRLLVGKVVAVHADPEILEEGRFIDYARLNPLAYVGNEYWSLGQKLATSGFSLSRARE